MRTVSVTRLERVILSTLWNFDASIGANARVVIQPRQADGVANWDVGNCDFDGADYTEAMLVLERVKPGQQHHYFVEWETRH
jgi:hypothetical protein